MWALSISVRPPPDPRATPITLGRPGAASSTVTSSPASRSQPATKAASSTSPALPSTSPGLVESMRTRAAVSSATLVSVGMRVEEVRPGLWRWTGLHPAWTPESHGWEQEVGCVYLETEDAVVLIDPLVPPEDEERFWRALDRDVERVGRQVVVVLTAPWHARSSDAIVARYDASVWAHPAGQSRLGRRINAPVLPQGIEVFEIPPADEGQVALFLPPHRALVTAEVLAGVEGQLSVHPSPQLQDRPRLASCLGLLLELPIEIVLPAHGRPILERGRDAVAAAVAHWAPSAA